MAASAAYVALTHIPTAAAPGREAVQFSNIGATTASFRLTGGQYGLTVVATFAAGSVTVQILAWDGTTWLTAMTAVTVAGYSSAYLPGGVYRIALA